MNVFDLKVSELFKFFVLCLALTACDRQPSAQDLQKDLSTVNSWAATARMTGEAWERGAVPEAYAQQTLRKIEEELQKQIQQINQKYTGQEPARKLPQLPDQFGQLQQTIQQMKQSVERHDRSALPPLLQQLSTQEQQLKVAEKRSEESSKKSHK